MRFHGVMKFQWLLAASCLLSTAHAADQVEKVFQGKKQLAVGYRYLLALPKGYESDPGKRWPLIVFLHGAGERGDDLNLLKKHGPPKLIAQGQDFPAIVASPQVPTGAIWDPHAVRALTDELASTLNVDRDRLYLTGISMGGFGTWETAITYPDLYAAIVPICGGTGVRWLLADRIKHLPAWIFHGGKDTVVEPANSEKIHAALKKVGSSAKLTIYPDAGHDSWTAAYADPALWQWLLLQRRMP
jgi:predicted peptidase